MLKARRDVLFESRESFGGRVFLLLGVSFAIVREKWVLGGGGMDDVDAAKLKSRSKLSKLKLPTSTTTLSDQLNKKQCRLLYGLLYLRISLRKQKLIPP